MKLAVFLFLCLVPLKLGPSTSVEQRFYGDVMFNRHIPVEQDVTRVEREYQRHFFVPKYSDRSPYTLTESKVPVIKKDTWTSWDDRRFPKGNDVRRERPYAVLPNSISFPDVKKRSLETLLVRRNGRKHERISGKYS